MVARDALARRIEERFAAQLAAGFLDEVAALAARPEQLSRTARQALGYKELLDHLDGPVLARRGGRHGHRPHPALRRAPGAVVPA